MTFKASNPLAPLPRTLQWEKHGTKRTDIVPPITLAAPQFKAEGYDNLVYDLNDIRDMLKHLELDRLDGHVLTAKRRVQVK